MGRRRSANPLTPSSGSSAVGRGDADTQLDALTELTAQRGDDRLAQVAFDLVLHKRRRHRQQGKPFGDDKRLDQLQPGSLLGREGGEGGVAVEGLAGVGVAVEFGNDVVPDGDEGWIGVSCQ